MVTKQRYPSIYNSGFQMGEKAYSCKYALEKLDIDEIPYVALFLKEINHTTKDKQQLRLPLIAACSMSKHIRLILPVGQPASLLVDDAFNELFKCQSQLDPQAFKDFVARSKGIFYAKGTTAEEEKHILRHATFLMTTDARIWRTALSIRLPTAFISQSESEEPEVMISNHKGIRDKRLRHAISIAFREMLTPWLCIDGLVKSLRINPKFCSNYSSLRQNEK
jgi:hypothetical protein